MQIIHIAAEFAPFAKVGGMADMVYGLAKAQVDHEVEVLLPHHALGDLSLFELSPIKTFETFTYQECRYENLLLILIQTAEEDFKRDHVYGYKDDVSRYLRFSFACYRFLHNKKNIIVHLHDWHTAFFAFLNKTTLPTLFTIHNLAYTGATHFLPLEPYTKFGDLSCLREGEDYHLIKAGLLFADQITTVSPTYAKEIVQKPSLLQPLLQKNADKLSGITNGIDTEYWDPSKDPYLTLNYNTSSLEKKQELKKIIKKHYALEEKQGFLVSVIARLVPQKGPEYIFEAVKIIQKWGGGCLLLTSSEDSNMVQKFRELKHPSTQMEFVFNELSAHLAYAATDLFLMPSIFEPCGLTQLIAMHYGTLPLVSRTGGLCDTVEEGKTGFFFENQNLADLKDKLSSTLDLWKNNPKKWKEMQLNGMEKDVSWTKSKKEYDHLYLKISKNSEIFEKI